MTTCTIHYLHSSIFHPLMCHHFLTFSHFSSAPTSSFFRVLTIQLSAPNMSPLHLLSCSHANLTSRRKNNLIWSLFDLFLISFWSLFDLFLISFWSLFDLFLISFRSLFDLFLISFWIVTSLGNALVWNNLWEVKVSRDTFHFPLSPNFLFFSL